MKDSRSLEEKMREAHELEKQGREDLEDQRLIESIRQIPTWQERLQRLLHTPVEDELRKKMHLERPGCSPSSEDHETYEDTVRRKMHLVRK
jgi:hypothetical protein